MDVRLGEPSPYSNETDIKKKASLKQKLNESRK